MAACAKILHRMSEHTENSFTRINTNSCTLQKLHLPCTFYLTLWMVVARMPNVLQHIHPGFPCRYTLCVAHMHDKSHAPGAAGCIVKMATVPSCQAPCKQENAGNVVTPHRSFHLSLDLGRHDGMTNLLTEAPLPTNSKDWPSASIALSCPS